MCHFQLNPDKVYSCRQRILTALIWLILFWYWLELCSKKWWFDLLFQWVFGLLKSHYPLCQRCTWRLVDSYDLPKKREDKIFINKVLYSSTYILTYIPILQQKRFKKIVWIQFYHLCLQWKFKLLSGKFTWGSKGPFKYYISKEVGGWGQKMAIFCWFTYYLCGCRWVGGPKEAQNMLT